MGDKMNNWFCKSRPSIKKSYMISNFQMSVNPIISNITKTSATRSATIVPNPFSKGTPS